jgi:hypothetical protein
VEKEGSKVKSGTTLVTLGGSRSGNLPSSGGLKTPRVLQAVRAIFSRAEESDASLTSARRRRLVMAAAAMTPRELTLRVRRHVRWTAPTSNSSPTV